MKFPEATAAFQALSRPCKEIEVNHFDLLQRFVITMYDATCAEIEVNKGRKYMFTKKKFQLENMPPTQDALMQHTLRCCYQAGHVWGQSCVRNPELPSPSKWGWSMGKENRWEPCWITTPEAIESCVEILSCQCLRKKCSGRCKCTNSNVQCTALCRCGGSCEN